MYSHIFCSKFLWLLKPCILSSPLHLYLQYLNLFIILITYFNLPKRPSSFQHLASALSSIVSTLHNLTCFNEMNPNALLFMVFMLCGRTILPILLSPNASAPIDSNLSEILTSSCPMYAITSFPFITRLSFQLYPLVNIMPSTTTLLSEEIYLFLIAISFIIPQSVKYKKCSILYLS